MRLRRIAPVALLLLVGGVGAWFLRRGASSARNAAPAALTTEERVEMLEKSLRALEDGVRDAPRDRWDPAYVVAMVGQNPDSLYRWVQDNTRWIPYRGTLRGPVGVLMDRQGNSLDRALLLADLLQKAGHSVRLARTEMPIERAEALLPELVALRRGRTDLEVTDDPVPMTETSARYGLDGTAIVKTLQGYEKETGELLTRLERRVASQTTRLLETVDAIRVFTEWKARADSALAMLRDHWWVQLETGNSWADLDVVRRDSADGMWMPAPVETVSPMEVDGSLHHRLTIRVVTERFTQGRLVEEPALEHTLRPSEVVGKPIMIQFWPAAWPALESTIGQTALSLGKIALEQDGWSAALLVGNDAVAQATLDASARAVKPASGIGGLGSAMSRALEPGNGDDNVLTATSIDYVIDVPGRKQRVVRRNVFDLIGPAARYGGVNTVTLDEGQKLVRSLSLMMRTDILPLTAQPNADYVAHLAASNMLANAALLRAVTQPGFGSDARLTDSLLTSVEPGVGPLWALGVLRHEAMSDAVFLGQPVILTRHRHPRVEGDSVGLVDATDIVANEVGVALSESDGFMARLAQGTWDTNLEALLGLAGGPAGNAAAAFEETKDWLTLTRADRERLTKLELPPDALARIGQDLDSGYTVVAPQRPAIVDRQEFSAWWRIDPQTGDALGIGENGWGQGSEYGNLARNILVVGGRAFVFEYGLCQFIPQMANSLRVIGGEFWRLGIAPGWTQPPEPGKDFEDVAAENNRVCLQQAMLQGFLATAPLLLATARYAAITRVERFAQQQASNERWWQEAIESWRGARMEFCLCTPREFRTGLLNAPVRGGPAIPNVDPLGKTLPSGTPRPTGPAPATTRPLTAVENLRRAEEAASAANSAANKAINEFIQYRRNMTRMGRPLDPYQDGLFVKRVQQMDQEAVKAIHEVRAAEAALSPAQRTERAAMKQWEIQRAREAHPLVFPKSPPPAAPPAPNLPGCPPNCGNEKATVDAAQAPSSAGQSAASSNNAIRAGSATLVNGFFQGRWPTGSR